MKISVVMEALTGSFETDINRATKAVEKRVKAMRKTINDVAKRIGVALTAAAGSFAFLAKRAIDTFDTLAKSSQKIGISTEALSGLSHAADLSGLSVEGLEKGLGRLARNAKDAAQGLATPQRAFDQLGISIKNTDGTLRDTEDLLLAIADKFSGLEDGTTKAALAQELFGRAGLDLIPLLNQGRDGLAEMTAEAKALGLVIGGDAAAAAEVFNDNLTRLQGAFKGVINQIVQRMLPALVELTNRMVEFAKTGIVERWANGAIKAMAFVADSVDGVGRTFSIFADLLVIKFATAESASLRLADSIVNGPVHAANLAIKGLNALGTDIPTISFTNLGKGIQEGIDRADSVISEATKNIQESLNKPLAGSKFLRDVENVVIETNKAASSVGSSISFDTDEKVSKAQDKAAESTENNKRAMEEAAKAAKALAEAQGVRREALQRIVDLEAELATPLERINDIYQRRIGIINQARIEEQISAQKSAELITKIEKDKAEEIGRITEDSVSELSKFAERAQENIQDALGDTLADALQGNFDDIGDSFRRLLATMAAEAASAAILDAFSDGASSGGSGGFFGSIFGAIFGGAKAEGGPVSANKAYLVGERGPEMFMPSSSGRIVANNDLNVTNNFNITAPGGDIPRKTQQRIAAETAMSIERARRRVA